MLGKLAHSVRLSYSNARAYFARQLVTRDVTRVLKLTHAQELMGAPRNEWPLMVKRQTEEIRAVSSGQMDIIDRRSWQYPYLPESLHRLNQPVLKNTPYNLRRFSETPVPRRAINLIKNAVLSLDWQITPVNDEDDQDPDRELRIRILTESLKRPNNDESFRDVIEAALEDWIIGGYACIEPRLTPYYKRPFKMWAVDGSTIRRHLDWTESTPDRPKWAQMTGLKGERGIVTFKQNELIYIRDNVRTSTPFGLGKLEVAFNVVNYFLGAQDMSGKAGSDQVHKTWLWWEQSINPAHLQTVRRHIINELEGQAKVSLMAGAKKPEVIDVQAVKPEDLLLDWQEFLIRIIACAFDISPQSLGLERDVNRNTAQVMAYADWRNAVVPAAKRFEEALNRQLVHGFLKWKDIQFGFIGLEDPDSMVKAQLQRIKYMMDAITPDEIREEDDRPPLPGGWGRMTMMQKMAIMQANLAKMGAKQGGMGGGAGAGAGGMGSGGMGGGMGSTGGMGTGGMGMRFAAQDVAEMTPDEISMFQELGLLPPTQQLGQQMEHAIPGILDTISEELRHFFELAEQEEEEDQVEPSPVTPEMEKEQRQKFFESEHEESLLEEAVNRRGVFGPAIDQSVRRNQQRGKYPRGATPNQRRRLILPKGDYRPGSGNTKL